MAASKLRYDDFVSHVQPDPAKPESTIMLSGFVGHGPEGHARVYPDPTLGAWYDIPEGDIIHSMPIADSKLGGSYIWVRANSEIKPGSAAASTTEAVQPQQAMAVGMTPTPRTHCRVCDPPMAMAAAALPRHTMPLCTQGAVTFCACTPGLDCMMGAMQAAFQPTPSAVTLCCLQAFGHPTPQTRCFVCDPVKR
jgi:hypothetical protein